MLLWMGIDMIRNSGDLSLNGQMAEGHEKARLSPVLVGMLASLSNPYWTLWWATIGLGYLVAAMEYGVRGIAAFFLGHIAADYAWYALVSLGISRGKKFLKDRTYQLMIRCCGLFLVGFAVWFLFSARGYLVKANF